KRGNQASGTPRVRPSVSSTHMVCSSNRTTVAEILMPRSQDPISIFRDSPYDMPKLSRIEAVAVGNRDVRLSPNLAISPATFDVNVWQFARVAFVREKEVSQAALAENDGHLVVLDSLRPLVRPRGTRQRDHQLRAPRRAAARVALHAGAVAYQGEVAAF